jgi:hypothetical protein
MRDAGIVPNTFENDKSNKLPGEMPFGMGPVKLTNDKSTIWAVDCPIFVRISEASPVRFVRDKLREIMSLPSHSSGKAPGEEEEA